MSNAEDGTTVTVTSKGQATIPKQYRDKLHIDTPGRVRFVENEEGDVVIQPVKRPSEIRGALAPSEADEGEQSASELLLEEREQDKRKQEKKHGLSETDE